MHPKNRILFSKLNYKYLLITVIILLIFIIALVVSYIQYQQTSQDQNNQTLSLTDKDIATVTKQLALNPESVTHRITLCQDYLQKVRETASSTYYTKCDGLLATAKKLEPMNADVIATEASVAYGRHDFIKGLALSQKAHSLNPNKSAFYGLIGDGQIELGQYEEAAASFQTMVDKRPDLSSFNRVAYVRELYGDISGAKNALNNAITAGSSFPENIAYGYVELGKLYARTNLDAASQSFNHALAIQKDYPPALEGLGKVAFARQHYSASIDYFNQAFTILPLAQYSTDLSDAYATQGNKNKAAQHYFIASLAFDKSSSDGVNNDFEKAVFLTDHNKDLAAATVLLQKAITIRPNVFSYDALAWNFYKINKFSEAQDSIEKALELGGEEPVVNYHAGMIAAKFGQTDSAKKYLQKAFSEDNYFLESHFSLLDRKLGTNMLDGLN